MTNAIVRNAKAKIIERRFRDIKDHISRLFPTYTGGTVVEKPECLKQIIKDGKAVPTDAEFAHAVEELLDDYINREAYGGASSSRTGASPGCRYTTSTCSASGWPRRTSWR